MKQPKKFMGTNCKNNHNTIRTMTVVCVGVVTVFLATMLVTVVIGGGV